MTGKVGTTLSDEHLRELSRVTVSFALLEHHLQLLAWELIHDFALGPVVTAELGWRSLVALVSALAHQRQLDATALKTLDDVLRQADAAEVKRNDLMHSTWLAGATSEVVRFKFTAKRGKGLRFQQREAMPGEIREVAETLSEAAFAVMHFNLSLREKTGTHAREEEGAGSEPAERLPPYLEELGGIREAAEHAGLPPATVYGWVTKRGPNLPTVLQLVKVARLRDRSLDWLVGYDVPESVRLTRTYAELAADLRAHLEARLAAAGIPTEAPGAPYLPDAEHLLLLVERYVEDLVKQRRDASDAHFFRLIEQNRRRAAEQAAEARAETEAIEREAAEAEAARQTPPRTSRRTTDGKRTK